MSELGYVSQLETHFLLITIIRDIPREYGYQYTSFESDESHTDENINTNTQMSYVVLKFYSIL